MADEPKIGSQLIAAVNSAGVPKAVVVSDDSPPRLLAKLEANVDIGDIDVLSVIPGTGATNLGKAEDAAHVSGDVGVEMLAVRTDTPTNRSGTDGDYEPLQVSAGRLWTAAQVSGPAADGAAVSGNPVRIGGKDTSGNTQDILTETDGMLRAAAYASDSTAFARVPHSADGNTTPIQSMAVAAHSWLFNGTSFDRGRSGSATSTDPHFGSAKVVGSGAALTLVASATQTANFSGTAKTGLGGFTDLIVTLDITVADRADANETYDFYITAGDGVSSWDIVHFPQIATSGAKRYTARITGRALPQNMSNADPGVPAYDKCNFQTETAGTAQGIRTLGAALVRHGPWGDRINHELVVGGTTPSITYSITITPK